MRDLVARIAREHIASTEPARLAEFDLVFPAVADLIMNRPLQGASSPSTPLQGPLIGQATVAVAIWVSAVLVRTMFEAGGERADATAIDAVTREITAATCRPEIVESIRKRAMACRDSDLER